MRYGLRCVVAVAVLWGVTAIGAAAEPAPSKKADTQPAASKSEAPTPAQLRVRMHRTLAALIEAQSADKPDQAKIDKLTKQLGNLRGKIWAGRPGPAMGRPGAGQCPWGGPRMGNGRGGPGNGYGRGPAGPGKGYGRGGPGKGYGPGPGYGRGPGGPGKGYGRGAGYGPGGPGNGYGRGMGRQWGFVDKDQDGVCDNLPKPQPQK